MESTLLPIEDVAHFKSKALCWANQFGVCCLLDGNSAKPHSWQFGGWTLAVDALEFVEVNEGDAFVKLKAFQSGCNENIFGFFSYELKNQIEHLDTHHSDCLGFPLLYFFRPRFVFVLEGNKVSINRNYPEAFHILEQILNFKLPLPKNPVVLLKERTSKSCYLQKVWAIKQKIVEGDFYEMNYCIEAFDEQAHISPTEVFLKLNEIAKAPFSAFFKCNERVLMCASPERFLMKKGSRVVSQPIKGTTRKGQNPQENEMLKTQLLQSEKERAENVMIVDLVRNDLARSCRTGSVVVEELCKVYEFETVNQMTSTVAGEVRDGVHFTDVIRNAFPMGSMTGAPKVEVMKTIEVTEDFQRGLFSGSVGCITPSGDFDFNVVIRSIFYNTATGYLSLRAGSAITFDADEEAEWNEVMLKLEALKKSLV